MKYFFNLNYLDVAGIELMYIQAVFDVVNSTYMCLIDDAFTLAALQLQVMYGDYQEGAINLIKNSLSFFLPERNIASSSNTIELCGRVLRKYSQLTGFTLNDAMLGYLEFVQEFPSYGSAYFFANPTNCTTLPKEIAIAINKKGVAIVDNYTKEYIEKFDYDSVITWGHSPSQFVIAVGTTSRQRKLTFKTADGKEMGDTIHAYVDWRTNMLHI